MIFRFKLLYFILMIVSLQAKAQNTIHIYYEQRSYYKILGGELHSIDIDLKLVFNDSLSLCYIVTNENGAKNFEKEDIIGERLVHHGVLFDYKNNSLYEEVYRPELRKKFLYQTKPKKITWFYTTETKTILGNNCQLANGLFENSKDTIEVWYSMELKKPFGPSFYDWGLPGVVLEAYDPRYSMHFYAKKIINSNQVLKFPKSAKIKKTK